MEKDEEWWTLADAIERGEQRNKALLQEARQEGHQEGQQKMLKSLITSKFQLDASEWIKTLDSELIEKATLLILSCDSFDELKQQTSLKDQQ